LVWFLLLVSLFSSVLRLVRRAILLTEPKLALGLAEFVTGLVSFAIVIFPSKVG